MKISIASNPFFEAYVQSDLFGKIIMLTLLLLSILTWIILLYKMWESLSVASESQKFRSSFQKYKRNPLGVPTQSFKKTFAINPFLESYVVLKNNTIDLLNKNHHFTENEQDDKTPPCLSPNDIGYVEANLQTSLATHIRNLEKNLFILSTVQSLAPFLGLLGTVWGILITFANMNTYGASASSQAMLGGISLALATTVMGLLNAIPALIGYSYLKNRLRYYETDFACFCSEMLAQVELHYRKIDV